MTRTPPPAATALRQSRSSQTVVAVRIPPDLRAAYERRAESSGRRLSDELRAALSRDLLAAA
jgi:hypothetical protein